MTSVRDYEPLLKEAIAEAKAAGLEAEARELESSAFAVFTTSSELLYEHAVAIRLFLKATRGRLPSSIKDKLRVCLIETQLAYPSWRKLIALLRRRRAWLKVRVLLSALVIAGCAPAPPFAAGFFSPRNLERVAVPLPPVAVYLFADERGLGPTLFLETGSISGREGREHATEPVSVGVTRAFVEALRARGLQVVDETARSYSHGAGAPKARVAISGRVLEFGARIARSGLVTYDQRVGCRVALEVHDSATGRRLWTKTYGQVTEGGLLPADPTTVLSRALRHVVEQAVMDAELLTIIRG